MWNAFRTFKITLNLKMNAMKKNLLLLCALALASIAVGCTGSQDIVEPDRDNFNTEPMKAKRPGFTEQ